MGLFTKKVTLVSNKRNLGKIPIPVARELVTTKHAQIVKRFPIVIGLKHAGKGSGIAKPKINSTQPLKSIIAIASKCVSKGNRRTILETIRFKVIGNKLRIDATDLEVHCIGYLELGKNYTITTEGTDGICVYANDLARIIQSKEETTNIRIAGGDVPQVHIGSFVVTGEKIEHFPEIPPPGNTQQNYIISDIGNKLAFVQKATSNNKTRSSLCGIYFDFKQGNIIGADGNRLHMVPVSNTNPDPNGKDIIIPSKIAQVAKYLTGKVILANSTQTEEVNKGDTEREKPTNAIFELNVPGCMSCTVRYQAVDALFPHYQDVIPKVFASEFLVDTKDFLVNLHKAKLSVSDSYPCVTGTFDTGQLTLSARATDRSAYEGIVKGKYQGPAYTGAVNPWYLIDMLENIPDESVTIQLPDKPGDAWVIKGTSGYSAVIMPVELR
ncbi:MAG: hypothetical protein DWB56_07980 [Candidatus Jettenia sp.]|uniref:Beta sliding clamp n=1 Tax=Candidatus Jettenia caeni TaxID=247490 RepID=I3IJD4_9BACT|nr:DNA polymerase III subunit beta [Candidatus Jettenia sp. AMX1]MBC6928884.1 hypothetical protein [Candidatus Jettenia sp.]GAB61829.1 putative DNA polymerase III beta subunit [Candidatus Jettenia caeni]KAA0250872.1 MAG: hypothetical protein EDM77_03435 [Candidatus Jettenia sp. AMX1]MCE7879885.1 hypothetical protein [Candidatus Jettenia sp. AMX1]MCQ3926664.1 hypothetical protein [Candidatus Jettenia sp.]